MKELIFNRFILSRKESHSLSCALTCSMLPRSSAISQSLTNAIIPPKCGCNTSSINSCVRADNNSFKHSDSLESSVVRSCHHTTQSLIHFSRHAVHRKLGSWKLMENECISHNFSLFAICLWKIIKIGGNMTKFWKTILHSFYWDTVL